MVVVLKSARQATREAQKLKKEVQAEAKARLMFRTVFAEEPETCPGPTPTDVRSSC